MWGGVLSQVLASLQLHRCDVDALTLHYALHCLWLAEQGQVAAGLLRSVQPVGECEEPVTVAAQKAAVVPQLLWQRNDAAWLLDVHGLGPAAAAVVVVAWVLELRALLREGRLPRRVGVVTGWGNHSRSKGRSPVRLTVANVLNSLNASPLLCDPLPGKVRDRKRQVGLGSPCAASHSHIQRHPSATARAVDEPVNGLPSTGVGEDG
jgi:hypothetical protein